MRVWDSVRRAVRCGVTSVVRKSNLSMNLRGQRRSWEVCLGTLGNEKLHKDQRIQQPGQGAAGLGGKENWISNQSLYHPNLESTRRHKSPPTLTQKVLIREVVNRAMVTVEKTRTSHYWWGLVVGVPWCGDTSMVSPHQLGGSCILFLYSYVRCFVFCTNLL